MAAWGWVRVGHGIIQLSYCLVTPGLCKVILNKPVIAMYWSRFLCLVKCGQICLVGSGVGLIQKSAWQHNRMPCIMSSGLTERRIHWTFRGQSSAYIKSIPHHCWHVFVDMFDKRTCDVVGLVLAKMRQFISEPSATQSIMHLKRKISLQENWRFGTHLV